ncbi:RHS repeat-associated protein [Arcticibacter tournemirensis]|uniref:DUF6443 domain-containing protein n=1 Tax=Arcticibacter tournemirensis TaxID=699437 RepID=A0A5M9GWX0_9SPHI|nr:DUF6443 domain-containing protein [Arcticibacter tournemirensis]KAA8478429.1 hypothetical protein F1649_17725 [Arcticibacter tournemirensis]TQM48580.1 RHS repeat-associated protein [Arcticibacter tournemirensis]
MNRLITLYTASLLLLFTGKAGAQTITKPSCKQTEIIRVENVKTGGQIYSLTAEQKTVILEYADGQSRRIQTVTQKGSPLQKDIVQPVAFDQYGLQPVTYLPYVSTSSDGSYQAGALNAQSSYYANGSSDKVADDNKPYTRIQYENSPLTRLLTEGSPGEGYQPGQHARSVTYRTNTLAEGVRIWKEDGSSPSVYSAGQLSVTESTDESGNITLQFKNKEGQEVLRRRQADETVNGVTETFYDIYYIYNAAGNVRYTLPPKAVSQMKGSGSWQLTAALLSDLVYSYTYDGQGRLSEKKAPGGAPVYIIYDPLDRPLLVQDGNLRAQNKWRYSKYDSRQRIISEGIYTDATRTTPAAMQSYVNTQDFSTAYCEERQGGTAFGYSNQQFPTSGTQPLLYYYYDNYDLNNDGTADYSYQAQSLAGEAAPLYRVRGQLTAFRKRIMGTETWLTSVTFYDKRGNAIQELSNNQLQASMSDTKTTVHDFTGNVLKAKTIKSHATGSTTILSTLSYDPAGRLKSIDDSYNGAAAIRVASYEYNELGQLTDKKLHSTNGGSTYLQSVDYRYNIRGSLISINNSSLTADERNDETNDVFGMEMLYEQADAGLGNSVSYTGMITAVKWKSRDPSGGTPKERSYRFAYDKLYRLKEALYQERVPGGSWTANGAYDEKNIRYDQNGNILTLQRNAYIAGSVTMIDNLAYSYSGNRLENLSDGGSSALGYRNLTGSASVYSYDAAGNLTGDPKKGLSQTYNELGRTEKITITTATGRYIRYTYDGSGTLIKKQQYDGNTLQKTTDYIESFVYENGTLSYFAMAEGRVRNTGSSLKAEYMIRDYQGNVRVSFEEQNGQAAVRQENSYYPYGLVMPGGTLPTQPNKNLYNGGSEWQNDYGDLPDYYQTFYRMYDAAVGRFMGMDPLADYYAYQSPYQYGGNNPVMYNDPLGDKQAPLDETLEGGWGRYGGTITFTEGGGMQTTLFRNEGDVWDAMKSYMDGFQAWGKNGANDEYTAAKEFASNMNEVKSGSMTFREKDGSYFLFSNTAKTDVATGTAIRGGVELVQYGLIPEDPIAANSAGPVYDGAGYFGSNFIGPGPDVDPGSLGLRPKDMIDRAAFYHDRAYFHAKASGISGALFNHSPAVAMADKILYTEALRVSRLYKEGGHIDPVTQLPISQYTYSEANAIIGAFGTISFFKTPLSTAQQRINNWYNNLLGGW